MAWQIFGTKTSPNPMSTLDTQSSNLAQWAMVDTTATGTDAITLAPTLSGFTAPAYANYVQYRFAAANTSTAAVTLRVSALAALNVYKSDGTTQVGSGDVVSGLVYYVTYVSTLNTGAGGWLLTPIGSQAGAVSNPVTLSQGGTGQTTALTARASAGLNIDQATSTSFNADSSIAATTRTVVSSTTAMTGGHTLTLPAANAVNAGQEIDVYDLNGVVGAQTLTIQRAGSDTINGGTSVTITAQYGGRVFKSDGTSKWISAATGGAITAGSGISVSGSTVSINTNNSIGVGAYQLIAPTPSTANGATVAGASCTLLVIDASTGTTTGGATPSGTWRNVCGSTVDTVTIGGGLFIRTA